MATTRSMRRARAAADGAVPPNEAVTTETAAPDEPWRNGRVVTPAAQTVYGQTLLAETAERRLRVARSTAQPDPLPAFTPAPAVITAGEAARHSKLVERIHELRTHRHFHHPQLGRLLTQVRNSLPAAVEELATWTVGQLEALVEMFELGLALEPGQPVADRDVYRPRTRQRTRPRKGTVATRRAA